MTRRTHACVLRRDGVCVFGGDRDGMGTGGLLLRNATAITTTVLLLLQISTDYQYRETVQTFD
jgi:hypothetical protein